jgi:peroxisomal trans-2-enoyl-CoA reductase
MSSIYRANLFASTTAVVTGGGTGIGKAIAKELLGLGGRVVLASRNAERLAAAVAELQPHAAAGKDAVSSFTCNIRDEAAVDDLMQFASSSYGSLDYLVCNAGGQFPSPAARIPLKGWNAVVDTNLTGTFLCCKAAYENGLRDSKRGGAIVNIIADMFNGFPGMAHTGAARSAVDNLTKSLALEWAAEGVRVNAVAPGVIYSDTAAANYPPGFLESVAADLPYHRLGTPEEVSSAVTYLLSPGARYVSGATLRVDGASSLYSHPAFKIKPHSALPPLEEGLG